MKVSHLDHYNLYGSQDAMDEVKQFYIDVLGFREGFRPDFGVDGTWLYSGDLPLLHLTVARGRVEGCSSAARTGPIHHIALRCEGVSEFREMLNQKNIPFTVGNVPELKLTQLFIHDPGGVCIELNFCGEK